MKPDTQETGKGAAVRRINDDEMRGIVDLRARALLGISGEEFVSNREKYRAVSHDDPRHNSIVELLLLTSADPVESHASPRCPFSDTGCPYMFGKCRDGCIHLEEAIPNSPPSPPLPSEPIEQKWYQAEPANEADFNRWFEETSGFSNHDACVARAAFDAGRAPLPSEKESAAEAWARAWREAVKASLAVGDVRNAKAFANRPYVAPHRKDRVND